MLFPRCLGSHIDLQVSHDRRKRSRILALVERNKGVFIVAVALLLFLGKGNTDSTAVPVTSRATPPPTAVVLDENVQCFRLILCQN